MNHQFDELTTSMAQLVKRRAAWQKLGLGLADLALAGLLVLPSVAADPKAGTSAILDPAGDALFPFDLFNAPVPPYLDIVGVSVSSNRGVFHFEIQMNAQIPANPSPGFTPSVNHLGATFGILTDPATAVSPIHFFGQTDIYQFNYYVGVLHSAADSGVGLGLGWKGFLIDLSTFTAVEIPLKIKGDTLIFETSATSLGNPASFGYVVASECDPVPITEETRKSVLLVDFAPDHGVATWPAQKP